MNVININGIKYNLIKQITEFNGIECFEENFIEQAHLFCMIDEKRIDSIRGKIIVANSY